MFLLAQRMFFLKKGSYPLGPIYQRHQNLEIEFRLVFEIQSFQTRGQKCMMLTVLSQNLPEPGGQ